MIFLEEKDRAFVFACQACKDINRVLSVRVMTDPRLRREIRKDMRARGLLKEKPKVVEPQYRRQAPKSIAWEGRKSKDGRYELVTYRSLSNGDIQLQMAIDGKLAPMMDDHIASREEYRTDEQYFTRVAQYSETMLHLFGDARYPLTTDETKQREQSVF